MLNLLHALSITPVAGTLLAAAPSSRVGIGLLLFLGVTLVVFAVILLIASHLKFEQLSRRAVTGGETLSPEETFELNVTRRLSRRGHQASPLAVVLTNVPATDPSGPSLAGTRQALRADDLVALYRGTVAMLFDVARDDVEHVLQRARPALQKAVPGDAAESLRLDVVTSPENGVQSGALLSELANLAGAQHQETICFAPAGIMPEPGSEGPDPRVNPATGLLKAERLERALTRYLAPRRREGRPASVLYLEVDTLEQYKEIYGEEPVQDLLNQVARLVDTHTRLQDLLSHCQQHGYLVCASCGQEQALTLAERLRCLVKEEDFMVAGRDLKVTVSIGVAAGMEKDNTPALLQLAAENARATAARQAGNRALLYDRSMRDATIVDRQVDAL